MKPEECILFSGAAQGAEAAFGENAERYFVPRRRRVASRTVRPMDYYAAHSRTVFFYGRKPVSAARAAQQP